ncbi:hypothetical protein OG481_09690 [Streptomyces longwoodensis]|uniref:hypothetical protein n=1 Tax=Streptomyces longwoodensis TaxID=68231 RepID=UPI002DD927B4|nr:hypothetical protein [Streptomyces longwoodensis]WRY88788.1 hypothetical protein OG481_09690 [Streptomyces longwoodensis]
MIIADALDTLWTLGLAALAWLTVLCAALTLALLGAAWLIATALRALRTAARQVDAALRSIEQP